MPDHRYSVCNSPECDEMAPGHYHCQLSHCIVCDGAEGSLTDECPGVKVEEYDQQLVYKGLLQFKNGEWFRRPYESHETPDPIAEFNADNAASRLNGGMKHAAVRTRQSE